MNNLTTQSPSISHNLVAQQKPVTITAHPDSGASGNYIMKTSAMKTSPARPISVGCPNGHILQSTEQTQLAIPGVPTSGNNARVFNELKTGNLLSIGQLCDSDCKATFSKEKMTITNSQNIEVLNGPRDKRTGLWTVELPLATTTDTPTEAIKESILNANGVIRAKTTRSDLAKYHYESLGSPAPSTLLPAIKNGFLKTFPGLTEELIKKHLPKSIESSLGHLNQSKQGTQSTLPKTVTFDDIKIEEDDFILPKGPGKTNEIMAAVHDITHRDGAAFGDLAGQYPIPSSTGSNYILVVYSYDSNAILAEPMKSRNKGDILKAYRKIHTKLVLQGLKP